MLSGSACSAAKPEIGGAGGDGVRDLAAFALLDVDRDVRDARPRKAASAFGRYSDRPDVLARKRTVALHAAGEGGEIAAHRLDIVHDDPGMIEQAFAGRGQLDAAAAALEQRNAERRLQPLDPLAGRGQRQMHALRAVGDAAGLRDRDEELKIDQIETHGEISAFPSSWPSA